MAKQGGVLQDEPTDSRNVAFDMEEKDDPKNPLLPGSEESKKPLLLPGVKEKGRLSEIDRPHRMTKTMSDVTVARVRAHTEPVESKSTEHHPRPQRSSSSRLQSPSSLYLEDSMILEQVGEELDRFMDKMLNEDNMHHEVLKGIVSRWPQAWDRDELKDLQKHHAKGLRAFEGPIGYKRPKEPKRQPFLKDVFMPLGLVELSDESEKTTPSASPSRQAAYLRDDFTLGKQVLSEFSLIHLAVYCHPDQAIRHLKALLENNADINTPASYPAIYAESSGNSNRASPLSSSSNSRTRSPKEDPEPTMVTVTALHIAVYTSKAEVVKFLLNESASPDSRATFDTFPDYNALHLAAAVACQRESQALHETAYHHYDKAKMMLATQAREEAHQVIALLLAAKADIRAADLSGRSCLRMLSDLISEYGIGYIDKWSVHMDGGEARRLHMALTAGKSKTSEMELESTFFRGMIVRLPDSGELTEEDEKCLANQARVITGHSQEKQSDREIGIPLRLAELRKLYRKDFRVVTHSAYMSKEPGIYIDCQLMTNTGSGSRTRMSAETGVYRFPRFITIRRNAMPSSPRPTLSRNFSEEVNPVNKFTRKKAWRMQGVIGQGYLHFQCMLDSLRQHAASYHSEKDSSPFRRFLTTPNFQGAEENTQPDDEGGIVPPRPSTATASFSKSRTITDMDDIEHNMEDADIDVVLDMPLPPGSRYKKSWIFRKGCLLHFATNAVIKSEEDQSGSPEALKGREEALDNLQLVLNAKADVHSRAYYRGRNGAFCTTTALHMTAASGCCTATALLLRAKASIEVNSTMNGMPYYHPLHNAAHMGNVQLTKLLLTKRANPNTTNNEGRTGLHLAVKQNHIEIVRQLLAAKGNVVLRDRQLGTVRFRGGGLTPLDMCPRANKQYSEGERAEIMAMLAPSFNGVNSFLCDLYNMATNTDAAIVGFLVDQALKPDPKKEVRAAIKQLRDTAVTGQKEYIQGDESEKDPVAYLATIIENAPRVGVRVMKDLLLMDPDMEDNVRGALPARANLKPRHQDSWLVWRRFGWFRTDFLCAYQPDANSNRHDQETIPAGRSDYPCWLHREDEPDPAWHRDLAPSPGVRMRRAGDADVQVKVLLLANALDVKILRAFARLDGGNCDVFAELVVQALIGATFDQVAGAVTILVALEEAMLFLLFMEWSKAAGHVKLCRLYWCVTAAIAMKEALIHSHCVIQYKRKGWQIREFFFTHKWSHSFKIIRLICLLMLVFQTSGSFLLDPETSSSSVTTAPAAPDDDSWWWVIRFLETERSPRKVLGSNIVVQGLQIVMLLRNSSPEAEFGRHILSILHSFGRLWAILVVMICFFFSFTLAFSVMSKDEDMHLVDLMQKVYRGLFLGDGAGIDFMEGVDNQGRPSTNTEWIISCLATFLFTICLLNISIAVFQTEYEKALKESYLHFWQHRSFYCMQTLLGPAWPWGLSECGERTKLVAHRVNLIKERLWRFFLKVSRRCLRQDEDDFDYTPVYNTKDTEQPQLVLCAGILAVIFLVIAAVFLFFVHHLHAIVSASCLTLALCLMQSLAVRGEAISASRCGPSSDSHRRFFLWICHRADFSTSLYIDEDVEKADIVGLKDPILGAIEDLGRRIDRVAEVGRRVDRIETRLAELEKRNATKQPALMSASAVVQEVQKETEGIARRDTVAHPPLPPPEHFLEDNMESLEWAAVHFPRS